MIVSPPGASHPALGVPEASPALPPRELGPHERRYELLRGLRAIVWEADPETHAKTFVSRHAEELLGHPLHRWLEEPDFWSRCLHPDDREGAVRRMRQAAREGGDHLLEYRMVAADGRSVWIRDLVHVVSDWQGRPRALHGVMVDVSPERRPSSGAGYEPATGSYHPHPTGRSGHPLSLRPARGSPAAGAVPPSGTEPLELAEVVGLNSALATLEPRLRELLGDGIDLSLRLEASPDGVRVSGIQLERALLDLALHARDSMLQGGVLELATWIGPASGRLMLSVVDSGIGLDAVLRARAFGSLFAPRPPQPSAGVSMAAVAEIVEAAGGSIVVLDEPGGGTRIEISLPPAA